MIINKASLISQVEMSPDPTRINPSKLLTRSIYEADLSEIRVLSDLT